MSYKTFLTKMRTPKDDLVPSFLAIIAAGKSLMQVTTSTTRRILFTTQAMSTYEETAREKWLFNYPAQVALAGTQIGWTSEVIFSFKAVVTTFYFRSVQPSLVWRRVSRIH